MASADEPTVATEAATDATAEATAEDTADALPGDVVEEDEAATPEPVKEAAKPTAKAKPKAKAVPVPAEEEGLCAIWVGVILVMAAVIGILCYFFPPTPLLKMLGLGGPLPGELTASTWDEAVAGKTVFVKFYAPWCGHCKRMKPAWDSLMQEYTNHSTILIATVECTGAGRSLCDASGVRGFPTLKYGDPDNLQDYKGGRGLKELRQFAEEKLGPLCGPKALELCDESQRAQLEEFRAMGAAAREALIKEKTGQMAKLEADWKVTNEALQKRFKEGSEEKEQKLKAIKDGGLVLLRQVQKATATSAEL